MRLGWASIPPTQPNPAQHACPSLPPMRTQAYLQSQPCAAVPSDIHLHKTCLHLKACAQFFLPRAVAGKADMSQQTLAPTWQMLPANLPHGCRCTGDKRPRRPFQKHPPGQASSGRHEGRAPRAWRRAGVRGTPAHGHRQGWPWLWLLSRRRPTWWTPHNVCTQLVLLPALDQSSLYFFIKVHVWQN